MSAPLTSRQRWTSLVLCGGVMLLDGYDLTAMPLAVPHLVTVFELAPEAFGLALSAVLLGLGVGAVLLAPLGDRHGRRRVILVALAVLAAATLGTASGQSITAFVAWRLVTGLALGACLPNVTALSAELALPGRRASTMTVVSMAIPLGAAGSGLVVPMLVSWGGWPAIFLLPGLVTLALGVLLALFLSESPVVAEAARGAGGSPSLLRLVQPPMVQATALICLLYGVNAAALYYVNSWVPSLLPRAGFSLATAAHAVALLQFGGMVIGLVLARLLDGGKVTLVMAASYGVIALGLLGFGLVPATRTGWGLLLLVAGGGISGVHVAILALASGLFPARLLSSAIGLAVAVARIGAIGGPLLGALVLKSGVDVPRFFALAALPAVLCLLLCLALPAVRRASAKA